MRTFIITTLTLAGLALASPFEKRQDLPMDLYDDIPELPDIAAPIGGSAPTTTSYDPIAAASDAAAEVTLQAAATSTGGIVTAVKRQVASCTPVSFNGPQVTVPTDSPSAFLAYPPFAAAASAAAQPSSIPKGYAVVPDFVNLNASVQDSHYLTYTTDGLTSYNPSVCSAKCDVMAGCTAFNIFYERDPLINDSPDCPATSSTPSATILKCAYYGINIEESMATNTGQWRGGFEVVITGSNSYVKTSAPTLWGYQGPVSFNNSAINAPAPVNEHGYLRVQTFGQNVPFDPSLCAASCAAQTAYNARHSDGDGDDDACIFFNVYVLQKNGANGVLTCTYYTVPYGVKYATNPGQYNREGDHFTVTQSYGYYVNGHYVE